MSRNCFPGYPLGTTGCTIPHIFLLHIIRSMTQGFCFLSLQPEINGKSTRIDRRKRRKSRSSCCCIGLLTGFRATFAKKENHQLYRWIDPDAFQSAFFLYSCHLCLAVLGSYKNSLPCWLDPIPPRSIFLMGFSSGRILWLDEAPPKSHFLPAEKLRQMASTWIDRGADVRCGLASIAGRWMRLLWRRLWRRPSALRLATAGEFCSFEWRRCDSAGRWPASGRPFRRPRWNKVTGVGCRYVRCFSTPPRTSASRASTERPAATGSQRTAARWCSSNWWHDAGCWRRRPVFLFRIPTVGWRRIRSVKTRRPPQSAQGRALRHGRWKSADCPPEPVVLPFPKRKVNHLFSRHGNLCPHLNAPQSIAVQLVRPFNLNSWTAVTLDRINCRIIWRAPTLKNDPVRWRMAAALQRIAQNVKKDF